MSITEQEAEQEADRAEFETTTGHDIYEPDTEAHYSWPFTQPSAEQVEAEKHRKRLEFRECFQDFYLYYD